MSTDTMLALIHAVSERGSVSMECESLKQAQRIKYRFYAFRDEMEKAVQDDDFRPLNMSGGEVQKCHHNAQRISVSINNNLSPPVLEFFLKDTDDELLKHAIAQGDAPVSDQEGALNKLLKGIG